MTAAVSVHGLGKSFELGERALYGTFRDLITRTFKNPFKPKEPSNGKRFWALKDISFAVEPGEVVGIIGRNGAGKSTLLKILSRITEPTEGFIRVKGRVGSLLEVGTGFHPELTGRENIFLNGALLGMKRSEMKRKLDEIVAFAEIEKFIDTPVKRYSSGMYVRLAFSVAAHLETEILVVDEVLAVGDIEFQKKCMGKMGTAAESGRTILLVSHNMNSVRTLSRRAIWLESGKIRLADSTANVVSAYEAASNRKLSDIAESSRNEHVSARFLRWEILDGNGEEPNIVSSNGPLTVGFWVQVNKPIQSGYHSILLHSADNQIMWGWETKNLKLEQGTHRFTYKLPGLPLRPGSYTWRVKLYGEHGTGDRWHLLDDWHGIPDFIIATAPASPTSDQWSGMLNVPCDFQIQETADKIPV